MKLILNKNSYARNERHHSLRKMLHHPNHDNDPPYQQSRIEISRYAARYAMLRKNDGPKLLTKWDRVML